MGSPEAAVAVADAVGTPEGAFEELTGSLQGWKRKVGGTSKKGGTPKKKDITFVAPDGEEIKTKRQLDKYLKAHPGTLTASDFEWGVPAVDAVTPTENRRRSARLNSKGRTSTEGLDEDTEPKPPVLKRSRKSRENGNDAASKDEPAIKSSTEEVPADKKEENGEDNGEIKAMDVDVSKVEVPAAEESKEVTAETLTDKAEDEKVVSEGVTGEKPLETPTEPSDIAVGNGDAEKPNGEAAPGTEGIHALVGEAPKPQEVEGPPAPEEIV